MDTEANQLEEQGEFRAAELLRLRADALQDQITVKLEDVRASRPGKWASTCSGREEERRAVQ